MYRKNDLEQIFDIMRESFPKYELKPKEEQEKLFDNNKYKIITSTDLGSI